MAKFRYKLNEMSKTASADEAEKELGIPKRKFEVGQITYSDDGTRKSEITAINPETGAVKWTITQLPGFEKLYDELNDLVDVTKRVYVKTKDDKRFRDFYEEARKLRNKVRTHLRNEYPDQYKRITRIAEDEVEEISTSGAAGAYNTPYAFVRKPKRKKGKYKYQMKMPSGMVSSLGYTMGEGTCGYDRDTSGKKLKGPGGLGEAIDLDIDDEFQMATLSGKSGKYTGYVDNGVVSFSVSYEDREDKIDDFYNESNIDEFIGKDHAFMELAKKYNHKWDIGPDYVEIEIDLKSPLNEGDTYEKMAAKGKKAGSLKQGTVRKRLGIKKGEKIPLSLINKELARLKKMDKDDKKKGVQLGDKNQKYYKALQLSKTLKTTTNVDEGSNDPGASLGPGPKAGPEGVTDSAYTKQFKYKLVPKTKDGTYVQKGSGMIVKKLF